MASKSVPIAFACLWIVSGALADGVITHADTGLLLIAELIKLALAIVSYYFRSTRNDKPHPNSYYQEVPFDEIAAAPESAAPRPYTTNLKGSMVFAFVVAMLSAILNHLRLKLQKHTSPLSPAFVLPTTTLFMMLVLRLCFSWSFSALQHSAALLQFCGLYIVQASVSVYFVSNNTLHLRQLELSMLNCATLILTERMYLSHRPDAFHLLNVMIFASGVVLSFFPWFLQYQSGSRDASSMLSDDRLSAIATLVGAGRDIMSLYIISQMGAVAENVIAVSSLALLLLAVAAKALLPILGVWAGCFIVLLACWFYFSNEEHNLKISGKVPHRYFWQVIASLAFLALCASNIYGRYPPLQPQSLSSLATVFATAVEHPTCHRKPTVELLDPTRKYHAFDNILLIVFFSHPRYGVNLDYYKETYSDYFPNIVFIGVANREDGGFAHSYDVVVDSYRSDENLTDPSFYKIAGRMAHHQLYTVIREHDCGYDGYMWAPFDTLLNVPRLQQFDQDRFWYHSPWGDPVPNPVLINDSHHAPPALVSPVFSPNISETWQGWRKDWWWGDPHVGLPVCMPAFDKVPRAMRERLATLTDGQTRRLIGGSQDTLYIPNRHRKNFMDVLSSFLETECFSEIALPTTVHLVLPPDENTLFVDHWWIWRPPFNVTFVRQKWEEGFEVDTFHRFYWSEKGEDGVWRGNHDAVGDVRMLLHDSAKRQRIRLDI